MENLSENRRARFDYDIQETFEAGIELTGQEVKSVKGGRMNIAGSYALAREGGLWLVNSDIPSYQPKNAPDDYDPKRVRRLLLHRTEIASLSGKLHEKGNSLMPVRVYLKHGIVKIELGMGRSRKTKDKREYLKKRAVEREIRREI